MKTLYNSVVLLALFNFILAIPGVSFADMYWERITNKKIVIDGRTLDSTLVKEVAYFKDNLVKIVDQSSGEIKIFNLDNRMYWSINPMAKAYIETTFDNLREANQLVEAKRGEAVVNMLAPPPNLSGDEKIKFIKRLQAQKIQLALRSENLKIVQTEEVKKIRSWNVKATNIMVKDLIYEKIWLTEDIKPPNSYKRFIDALIEVDSFKYGHYKGITGFPIMYESDIDGVVNNTEVIKAKITDIPAIEFIIPLNFEKKPFVMPSP